MPASRTNPSPPARFLVLLFVAARMPIHIAVMPAEVLAALQPQPGMTLLDGTLGAGGHTRLLAERVGPSGTVIGLDRDPAAIAAAEQNLAGLPVKIAQGSYCEAAEVLREIGVETVDGVVLDLGLSSDQLADDQRGFSFHAAGELDMRFNPEQGRPAWRLLAELPERELANLIFRYGEERFSRRIARQIVAVRKERPLRTPEELASLVRRCTPRSADGVDPATRTFQALRIAANDELGHLERVLKLLPQLLRPGGRAAIISFHSLEDRLVKEAFRSDPRWNTLTKKPLRPSDEEAAQNPRSRSAKMRVAERV